MAARSTIPEKFDIQILSWFAEGLTPEGIKAKFKEEMGLEYALTTVRKKLQRLRKEQEELNRSVMVVELAKSINTDMKILRTMNVQLFARFQTALLKGDENHALKISSELNKWMKLTLELTPIENKPLDNQIAEEREKYLNELSELIDQNTKRKNTSTQLANLLRGPPQKALEAKKQQQVEQTLIQIEDRQHREAVRQFNKIEKLENEQKTKE